MIKLLIFCCLLGVSSSFFSDEDKQAILDSPLSKIGKYFQEHNAFRSDIARGNHLAKDRKMPQAANMIEMTWSGTLEKSAQAWSDHCMFKHSHEEGVGENLYKIWSSGLITITGKGRKASKAWANEFEKFGWNYTDVILRRARFRTGVGHATQMAWAATTEVGCGATICNQHAVIVTCQYKPPGNYIGSSLYMMGATCSECPSGTACDTSTGLCA